MSRFSIHSYQSDELDNSQTDYLDNGEPMTDTEVRDMLNEQAEEIKDLKRLNRSQELTIEQFRGPG